MMSDDSCNICIDGTSKNSCKDGASKSSSDGVCEVNDMLHNMSMDGKDIVSVCDNCGKEGSDNMNTCNKCKMTKYCNAACKKKHRHKHKKDCLPILDPQGNLTSLVFKKDYEDHRLHPLELLDDTKRLCVGAAINTHDYQERVPALLAAGADAFCFDSSDGFSEFQRDGIDWIREKFGNQIVIGGGNVVSAEGFDYLVADGEHGNRGVDFIKVGIGGGSICITREQKGVGRGQASALQEVSARRDAFYEETGRYIPICSDGGLASDTQIVLALAMGADFVMMGRYFAMTEESPSPKTTINGQMYKPYWGEGTRRAQNWQRYSEGMDTRKMVFEEGVDAYVPLVGPLGEVLEATLYKLKSTMINIGAESLSEFRDRAILTLVSEQSVVEGGTSNVFQFSPNRELDNGGWGNPG